MAGDFEDPAPTAYEQRIAEHARMFTEPQYLATPDDVNRMVAQMEGGSVGRMLQSDRLSNEQWKT